MTLFWQWSVPLWRKVFCEWITLNLNWTEPKGDPLVSPEWNKTINLKVAQVLCCDTGTWFPGWPRLLFLFCFYKLATSKLSTAKERTKGKLMCFQFSSVFFFIIHVHHSCVACFFIRICIARGIFNQHQFETSRSLNVHQSSLIIDLVLADQNLCFHRLQEHSVCGFILCVQMFVFLFLIVLIICFFCFYLLNVEMGQEKIDTRDKNGVWHETKTSWFKF